MIQREKIAAKPKKINRYIVGCKLTKYYKDTLNGAVWR